MMSHPNDTFSWSETHNSQFELSKLALMNYSPKHTSSEPLILTHPLSNAVTTIIPSLTYKF